jgi:dipeptidase D
MNTFQELTPQGIWKYFHEITKVPRPSKKEEKIIEFLLNFAKDHHLPAKKDAAGNILITRPADKGMEQKPVIVLQSHMDMVCEKNEGTEHNFDLDPIKTYIDGEWIKAKGTTLGADDGIGIAAMLAVLTDASLKTGAIECLFTVDEETGLTGAFELKSGFFTGKTLINLDSEDEGEIFIGCAGGKNTVAKYKVSFISSDKTEKAYRINLTGLTGGHSGDDIHRGYANALKLMVEFLKELEKNIKFKLARFEGGNLHNAIPREAFSTILVEPAFENDLNKIYVDFKKKFKDTWENTEPSLNFIVNPTELPDNYLEESLKNNLLNALDQIPNGVISWDENIPGFVKTSTNLASVKLKDNIIEITSSQRSSSNIERDEIVLKINRIFTEHQAEVKHNDGYPGWAPNNNSAILKKTKQKYIELFNEEPKIKAIHAGLECGLFLEKYPELDMVSIGPTVKGVHSPDERLHIPSVKKFWDLLIAVIG